MFDEIAQSIPTQIIEYEGVSLHIKRLDLIHAQISGNKFFKLKYNLMQARKLGCENIISFGGAYSNHIAATAFAAHFFGFNSLGIIRGEELKHKQLNPTLLTAQKYGMLFEFIPREQYRLKNTSSFMDELRLKHPHAYILPEGGTNHLAILGCSEILNYEDAHFDYICCAVGTGGTISGLIEASQDQQRIIGFSALKGDFLKTDVQSWTTKQNWQLIDTYVQGGYAKTSQALHEFMQWFESKYHIPLEPIYTGKMLYGIFDMIRQGKFHVQDKILVIHSGGLQGRQH